MLMSAGSGQCGLLLFLLLSCCLEWGLKKMAFVDEANFFVKAGDGGNGCVRFPS